MVPRKVDKPWGHELIWAETENYAAKILTIAPGCCLSLQYHERKEETIYVQRGQLEVTYFWTDGAPRSKTVIGAGGHFHVPPKMRHQFAALDEEAIVFEVSTPHLDDVVRLEDRYGRVVEGHREQ